MQNLRFFQADAITKFRGEFAYLSNFYPCKITVTFKDGNTYTFSNAEALFQSAKCPERAAEFAGMDGPTAKRAGNRHNLPLSQERLEWWENHKTAVMTRVIDLKFDQNPDLTRRLADTGNRPIFEGHTHDRIWGAPEGIGENRLGQILERKRAMLQSKTNKVAIALESEQIQAIM